MGAGEHLSAYRNVFSSERVGRRLCSSRELVSQRLTWDKLKRPKSIFRRLSGGMALREHPSRRAGRPRGGREPPESSQWGGLGSPTTGQG